MRHLLTGWLAGELSPFLTGRVETDQYRYGLATCENWIPTIEGPLVKRAGFEMIRPAAATAAWLTAFRRGVTQEYVLEWSDATLRFYTLGGRIESGPTSPYEVTVPFTAAEAPYVSQQQNYDRLYTAHIAHAPGALSRLTATTFAYAALTLKDGPLADPNSNSAILIGANATSGSVTLTASGGNVFDAGMVGSPVRLEVIDFGDAKAWESGMAGVAVGDKCVNAGKVYQAAAISTGGKTGTQQPTHTQGAYWDGLGQLDVLNAKGPYGVKWQYLYDKFGMATITAVATPTSATAIVTRTLPDSLTTSPTWRWALGAFSDYAGWPHLVTLWKGRAIYFKDLDIVGSVVGDYGGGQVNFASYSNLDQLADDLAFRRTLSLPEPPLWVARDRKLILGTPTREVAIGPTNAAQALTGSNITADDQSFYGSEAVFPVQAGTQTLFIERGAGRVRGADYSFGQDRYDAEDLTASSRHIAGPGIRQLAYQRTPQPLVYAVREDGQLAFHPKSREAIKGWARVVLGGGARALSAVSIVGADGRTEELWLLVERENGAGSTVREIWKQAAWRALGDDQAEAFFVDGGVRIAATAGQVTFTGLDHLAGQAVAVLAAGGVVPGCAVSGTGVLTLPSAHVPADRAFTVVVGLAYSALAVGLRPEVQVPGGSSQGLKQKIRQITLRLLETVGIKVGQLDPLEDDGGPLENLIDRPGNSLMDHPIPLASGDHAGHVDAAFDRSGIPRWISADPLPAMVAAAMLDLEVDVADA